MSFEKTTKNGIAVYHVDKIIPDDKMSKLENTFVKASQIKFIIRDDADVYDKEGNLILRFRKNKLSKKNIDQFYDNVIDFAMTKTSNRGSASGSKYMKASKNPKIMTNIIGYFDKLSPMQKYLMKKNNKTLKHNVRATRFIHDYPEKYEKLLPYIKEIDTYYAKYVPDNYRQQRKKANQTHFRIPGTSFTTVTTNVNFRTTMHTDKGDDSEGFGNLTVIERGTYEGGETCFPQYGIGVDVRNGDVLFMNVHKLHGNLPMRNMKDDAKRLSVVCYLRYKVWEKTRGMSKDAMLRHNHTVKNLKNSK